MRKTWLLPLILLSACGSKFDRLEVAADKAVTNISCKNSESYLYDVLYTSLTELQTVPTESDLEKVFNKALSQRQDLKIEKEAFLRLVSDFYRIVLKSEAKSSKELLAELTALEIGDQTTLRAQKVQTELKAFQSDWNRFLKSQDLTCPQPEGTPSPPPISTPTPNPPATSPSPPPQTGATPSVSWGGRKVLATAYQSCEALNKIPMTLDTRDVVGIVRTGTHSDGVGGKREIADLKAVQATHYYLQGLRPAQSCLDVRNNPLIYDYGGKPYTTADDNSTLDFFRNMGTGTSVLGIDCSGYVFSAIATAGMKLDPNKRMKAIFVHGINARMYMEPEKNGLPCFEKVKMGVSGTLRSGDIMAIPGHVVIVDSTTTDPLAVLKRTRVEQCDQITSKEFNFVISQSSPSKNGIGINRYMAADYLADEAQALRSGLEKYARDACRARFAKTDILMKAADFQVIRHTRSASCLNQPIRLAGETCVQNCRALATATAN